jgi:DNA-binding transcriptional LysR family regulator
VDIQQLRYFVAVADELHFGHAAERLHVTPSPLSRRIKELEHELGSELFIRGYHRVRLTRFGYDFLAPARDVLRRFDDLKHLSQGQGAFHRRDCRIGAAPLTAPLVLETVLDTFHKVAPGVEVPLIADPSAELLDALATGEIDLAVVHLPLGVPELDSLLIADGPYTVAMRTDDELAERRSLTLTELREREVLMASQKVHPFYMGAIRKAVLDAGIIRIVDLPHTDILQVAAQVSRTGALSLVPGGSKHPSARIFGPPDYRRVPLNEPLIRIAVGVAWRPGSQDEVPGLGEVLAALRDQYEKKPVAL